MTRNNSELTGNTGRAGDGSAGSYLETVLCGASAYKQKYYFNKDFDALPKAVKDELQIMCVMYTEEIGGVFTVGFDAGGSLLLNTFTETDDFMYDEIGSRLRIKQLRSDKRELFEALETYFKVKTDVAPRDAANQAEEQA